MKRKTLGFVMAAAMLTVCFGGSSVLAGEAKDVTELIVGELHYSVA